VLLLTVDTSTPTITAGVVSLLRPHEIAAQRDSGAPLRPVGLECEQRVTNAFGHAEQLMPLVNAALQDCGRRLADLEAVVVGLGPGPFTGLRVGIATAQALGDALDIPVHGVASHDATALADLHADPRAGCFLVVTDARRREVYLSAYSDEGRRLFGPVPLSPSLVPQTLAGEGIFPVRTVGAGAALLADLPPSEPFAPRPAATKGNLSTGLVLAAARALLTGAVPGPLTPLYLRRPDASEPRARKSVLGS
jgi:tRNA threonylcarbamoyl adenosine modification protein YeaZ